MKNNTFNLPLTDGARQALESLTEEYKQRILEEADSRALRVGGVAPEISIRDIMESAEKVASARRAVSLERKRELLMQICSMTGVFLTMFGIVFILKEKLEASMDISQQLTVIVIIGGITFAVFPLIYKLFSELMEVSRLSRESSPVDATAVFISRWQNIEMLLRKHLERQGHSAAREPFSAVVSTLLGRGLLSDADASMLKRLLSLRNQVVHETGLADKRMLENAIELSGELIDRLRAK
jgi:hypothetical protein